MLGVNAGAVAPFTWTGADHLRPPSALLERAMASWAPPEKRASSKATYSVPFGPLLVRSTAMLWTTLPDRMPRLLFGSLTPTNCASAMVTTGSGQLIPRSEDRIAWRLTRGFV